MLEPALKKRKKPRLKSGLTVSNPTAPALAVGNRIATQPLERPRSGFPDVTTQPAPIIERDQRPPQIPTTTEPAPTPTPPTPAPPAPAETLPGVVAPLPPESADREADVGSLVAREMATDSELMQMARTEGQQQANARGMLNSSIGIGAAEDSAYRVALPIASQTAQQNFQANEAARGRNFEGEQRAFDRGQQRFLQDDLQAQEQLLQKRGFAYDAYKADLDRKQQLAMQRNEIEFNKKQASLDRDLTKWNTRMERTMQDDRLIAEQRQQVTSMVQTSESLYQNSVANIMANTEMSSEAREDALAAAKETFEAEMALIEDLYGVDLTY